MTRLGHVKGEHVPFAPGHHMRGKRKAGPLYLVQDCGYTTPCWVWQRKITHGYAYETVDRKAVRAARLFYERHIGPIPDGLTIDHLCRNRACVNPDHLEPVTQLENIRRKPATKLSVQAAAEIRKLIGTVKQRDLARRFGVSESSISRVVNGETWE